MNIFVGNFPLDTDEKELSEAFERCGEVTSVQIIKDRATGESRGFAFVEMPLLAEARVAVEQLNETDFKGRTMNVSQARPRPHAPKGNRSRGGGRRQRDLRRKGSRKRGGKRRSSWGY